MNRVKRKNRERYKIQTNNKRCLPRLFVICSEKNVHAQIIQDNYGGKILASISTLQENVKNQLKDEAKSYNVQGASIVGEALGQIAKSNNILEVVFDKGSKKYHGRIKAFADGVRRYITI